MQSAACVRKATRRWFTADQERKEERKGRGRLKENQETEGAFKEEIFKCFFCAKRYRTKPDGWSCNHAGQEEDI